MANTTVGESKAFFASSEGASFHASSFMELNLSRPLLRACEALGYFKPTPIQVFFYLQLHFFSTLCLTFV